MRVGRSIITRVIAALILVVVAFGSVLALNEATQRSLVERFSLVAEGYSGLVRGIEAMQRDAEAFSVLVSPTEAEALASALRAARSETGISVRVNASLARLRGDVLAIEVGARDDERSFVVNVGAALDDIASDVETLWDRSDALRAALAVGDTAVASMQADVARRSGDLGKRLDDLGELIADRAEAVLAEAREEERLALVRVLGATSAAVLVSLLAILHIRRSLAPVRTLTEAAGRMKQGDYSPGNIVAGEDEIGQLTREFVDMVASIRERDARLRAQRDELEKAYRELLQAQEALLDAERLAAVGEMSSRITHELRNPLSSIGLNVEMIADELRARGGSGGAVAEMLRSIEREVERLTELTEGYLGLARRDRGRREAVDIAAVVRETQRLVRPELETHGIELEIRLTEGSVALADPDQIRQLVMNLLRNAADALRALPAGDRRRIAVSVTGDSGQVEIRVDDSGPGVPDELVAQIFDPFVTTRAGGTGLGLAICRRIAQAHGGEIRADARGDLGGASFRVRLPRSRVGSHSANSVLVSKS